MHVLYCNTTVDDFHSIVGQDICYGAAAAFVHLAQFRCLIGDLFGIQNISQFCDVFRIGVVGTGFTTRTRIFVKGKTFAEISAVVLLHDGWIVRIECCTDIG